MYSSSSTYPSFGCVLACSTLAKAKNTKRSCKVGIYVLDREEDMQVMTVIEKAFSKGETECKRIGVSIRA